MTSTEEAQAYQRIKDKLSDRRWRLNNLYYIKDKAGKKVLFRFNWAQGQLYNNLWYFNLILKARQLGFTTFTMIYFLDACLFNSNHSAGVIAHTKVDAEDLFENKAKFAYDNLPEWLKESRKADTDTAKKLVFNNGSSFTVGTSLRSGTYQKLLVSEYGKVSAKFPEKAREIKTGALNTVESGQQIFVESTAEGKAGEFFDLCETARKLKDLGKQLNPMEPKFHFFPWWANPDYAIEEFENIPVKQELRKYFNELGLNTTPQQIAWYAIKESVMGFDMKREYPSTPDEAFEGSQEGAYYTDQLSSLRQTGKICAVPYNPVHGVFTFWDLGLNDQMSIWFAQLINSELRFIDYHESNNQGWDYYVELLREKRFTYVKHIWPHDGNKGVQLGKVTTSRQIAEGLGITPIHIIPVTKSVADDIRNYCKPTLYLCSFDHEKCAAGLIHLDNYRKKWDSSNSMFMNEPQHDEASHCADAFRTGAMAYHTGALTKTTQVIRNKSEGITSKRLVNNSRGLRRR